MDVTRLEPGVKHGPPNLVTLLGQSEPRAQGQRKLCDDPTRIPFPPYRR